MQTKNRIPYTGLLNIYYPAKRIENPEATELFRQATYTNLLTNFYYPDPGIKLTTREREILGRLADGLSRKQIAGKLFLSESTIANHRKNILKKTNTRNVAELISHAIGKGII